MLSSDKGNKVLIPRGDFPPVIVGIVLVINIAILAGVSRFG
jgi:hypothetical protein